MATIRTTKQIPLSDIQPHPDNPNHGDAGAISISLQHHGQYRAIVVSEDSGNILAGNHTYLAAKMNGAKTMLAHLIPGLSLEDEVRIMVADNQYAKLAYTDDDVLADLLKDLAASDDGLLATGWDGDLLDELLADLTDGETPGGDGDVVEAPPVPVTKLGDRWRLRKHILVCGDATDPAAYGEPFDLLWTDPPYGVSYADKNTFLNSRDGGSRIETGIEADHQTPDEMKQLWTAAFTTAKTFAKDDAAYYTTGPQGGDLLLLLAIRDAGWQLKHMLIWAKENSTLGRTDYHYQHEPVLYGWNVTHTWHGDRSQHSLLQHSRTQTNDLHPTMKPISLIEQCITNSTKPNDIVCDPFAGSGSTLIACENLNRKCHAIELDPRYCDVIIHRWETLTGQTAHLME